MNEYFICMNCVIVYRTYVFVYVLCVEEEMGDVLRGVGEDRGCTSKPVSVGRR